MPRLEPETIDAFLRRFHRGRNGELLGIDVRFAGGSIQSIEFALRLLDADAADAETLLHLRLAEVSEMRLQVRPTENRQSLTDGIAIGTFGGVTFVDFMPWTDPPSGVHDFRLSNCYAAGAVATWELTKSGG